MDITQQIEALKKRRSQSGKKKNWTQGLSPEAQVAMRLALEDTKAMNIERENTLRLQNEQKQNEQGKSKNKVAFVADQTDHGHEAWSYNVKSLDVPSNVARKSANRVAFVPDIESCYGNKTMDLKHSSSDANHLNDSSTGAAQMNDISTGAAPQETSYRELYEKNGSERMRRDMTDESYSEESDPKRALGGGKVESTMELVEIVNHDKPDESTTLDEHAIEELRRINSVDKCTVWIEATEVHQRETLADIPEVDNETCELACELAS